MTRLSHRQCGVRAPAWPRGVPSAELLRDRPLRVGFLVIDGELEALAPQDPSSPGRPRP